MIATKALPSTRVTNLAPASRSQLDPRWDRAREFYAGVQKNLLGFAEELEHLRELYLSEGHGGDRRSKNQVPHDAALDLSQGFQAAVERELGISKNTAYRYLAVIQAVGTCDQIISAPAGELIELDGGDTYKVTAKAQEQAKDLREEIATGGVPMSRALPAVKGLFIAGGSRGGKAATDHSKNCKAAAAKWATSLEHYYNFSTADRDYLDATFSELLANGVIPESWLVMVAKQTKGGRRS